MTKISDKIEENAHFSDLGRREFLSRCTLTLSSAALASVAAGCAQTSDGYSALSKAQFTPVNPDLIKAASSDIAKTLLGYSQNLTPNDKAMKISEMLLQSTGLSQNALYGSVDEKDGVGQTIIFNGGPNGFVQVTAFTSSKFTPPILVRKGLPTDQIQADFSAAGCLSHFCTNNTDGEHAFSDLGADEQAIDSMLAPSGRRPAIRPADIDIMADVLTAAAGLLAAPGVGDPGEFGRDLKKIEERHGFDGLNFSATKGEDYAWYDLLMVFSNETSATLQIAKGNVEPFYRLDGGELPINLKGAAEVQWRRGPSNDPDLDMIVPHVTPTA